MLHRFEAMARDHDAADERSDQGLERNGWANWADNLAKTSFCPLCPSRLYYAVWYFTGVCQIGLFGLLHE